MSPVYHVCGANDQGEIRATGFNDAVDQYYELMQEGKVRLHDQSKDAKPNPQVFFISRARVNIAKKQFSNVNNEYEIMFGNDTEVEPVSSLACKHVYQAYLQCDDESVPKVKYSFKSIGELGELQKDEVCGE